MSGLSLWLSPSPSSSLSSFPTELSKRYDTVSFDAHATLVSDEIVPAGLSTEEVLEKVKEGVKKWKEELGKLKEQEKDAEEDAVKDGLELEFWELRTGPKFYQCVLLSLHPSPSLLLLHNSLLSSFSLTPPSPPTYFPHLSLVYGDLPLSKKEEIVEDLRSREEIQEIAGEDKEEVLGHVGFRAREVRLVKTGGSTEEWEVLGTVPL